MNPRSVRLPFKMGRLLLTPDTGVALTPAGMIFATDLRVEHSREDRLIDVRDLGSGLVTDAGVAFLVDDWDTDAQDITTFNFHATGIGTTAAAVGDTALQNTTGAPARVAGTKSQPAANQLRTIATVSYTSTLAITEWGLFSASTSGTLWDRRVFSAINVVNGDSIQFTYTLTVNSGG